MGIFPERPHRQWRHVNRSWLGGYAGEISALSAESALLLACAAGEPILRE